MIDLDSCVIYQIYPMSFQDSNDDGMGDINGIRQRLGYLAELGVDMLWLTPIYCSPKHDNGYDIADYRAIDPAFGTMAEMEALIAEARKHGIGIMMDIVANHTSIEHEWFQQALAGDPYYQAYYVFRDRVFVESHPLRSIFGGSAWQYIPSLDCYYLHNFAVSQANLDWDNPDVRAQMAAIVNFWLEKGVKGFRFDVIDMISKEWSRLAMSNGPRLHDYIQALNRASFGKKGIITVGETWGADLDRMRRYSSPEGDQFSMVFNFEHLGQGADKWTSHFDVLIFKKEMIKLQQGLHSVGWNSLFMSNHDLPRAVSRLGNPQHQWRELSAKQWAIVLHLMQGTPFIYQGEEIGMTNRHWQRNELRDIEAINYYSSQQHIDPIELSRRIDGMCRDNARTPMQWNDSHHGGFSRVTPWITLNENYAKINVAEQLERPDSLFYCYKSLIALRKAYPVIRYGNIELLDEGDPQRISYQRSYVDPITGQTSILLLLANLTAEPLPMTYFDHTFAMCPPLISNYCNKPAPLFRPYETVAWLLTS